MVEDNGTPATSWFLSSLFQNQPEGMKRQTLGVGNRARPRTAGDGAGHGLLANHRRTPPQIGSVTLALTPEPSGCDTPPPDLI